MTYHEYRIVDVDRDETVYGSGTYASITFQKGPVAEAGKNGIFIEDPLQTCSDAFRRAILLAGKTSLRLRRSRRRYGRCK
jgi:hypothetical protein